MSDRIVVMNRGRVEQIGTAEEIYERPANRFVAAFVGKINFLAATLRGREGDIAVLDVGESRVGAPWPRNFEAAPDAKVVVAVRPEKLFLTSITSGSAPGDVLHGTVEGAACHRQPAARHHRPRFGREAGRGDASRYPNSGGRIAG